MLQDVRLEWRINDIERNVRAKADYNELASLSSTVDRLERTIRELSSEVVGLRSELEACQSQIEQMLFNH